MGLKLSWSIRNNSSLLHKHCSKSSKRSIAIYFIILVLIWQNQYWWCNQTFLQLLETGLTFLSPFELGVLLQQLHHGFCNLREILNEPPVVSCESEKTSDLSNRCGCFPICHSDDLGGVYFYSYPDITCPRKPTSFNQNSHLLNLAYNWCSLSFPSTKCKCSLCSSSFFK